jgi:hypothetical protein
MSCPLALISTTLSIQLLFIGQSCQLSTLPLATPSTSCWLVPTTTMMNMVPSEIWRVQYIIHHTIRSLSCCVQFEYISTFGLRTYRPMYDTKRFVEARRHQCLHRHFAKIWGKLVKNHRYLIYFWYVIGTKQSKRIVYEVCLEWLIVLSLHHPGKPSEAVGPKASGNDQSFDRSYLNCPL